MAQVGFYSAVPKGWDASRRDKLPAATLRFPEIPEIQYLVDVLTAIGVTRAVSPELSVPIGYGDVRDYRETVGVIAEPWEADALVRMSRSYVWGYGLGRDQFSFSPMEISENGDSS